MALESFRPAGLNRDLWLPANVDVQNRIVSHPRVRSYQKYTSQSKTTVHDTGNDATDVAGEYAWLAGGRSGAGAGGYNAITDRTRIWFCVPHDEVTWHAGTTLGNRTSWGVEWAYGKDKAAGRWDASLETNARLHAAYAAAMDWEPETAIVLHQYWYGKYCSRQILSRSWWDEYQLMITGFVAEARAAAGLAKVPTAYAKPRAIAVLDAAINANLDPEQQALTIAPRSVLDPVSGVRFVWVGDRVRTTAPTPRLQYAFSEAPSVGPDIATGEEFDVDWWFIADDGEEYYLTPWRTRVPAATTIRVSDAKSA